MGIAARRIATVALLATVAPAHADAPRPILLAPDRLDAAQHLVWTRRQAPVSAAAESLRARLLASARAPDSLVALRLATTDSVLRAAALRGLAMLALTSRDSALADSAWAQLVTERSPWAWEAARSRADLARPRFAADTAWARFAEELYEGLDTLGFTPLERSAWRLRRAEARALLGDTASAIAHARVVLTATPPQPTAGAALDRLQLWMRASGAKLTAPGSTLTATEERAAAEVDWSAGRRTKAVERLGRAIALGDTGTAAPIRRSEMLRVMRRFDDARATVDAALRRTTGEPPPLLLERARVLRDAGKLDAAISAYRRATAVDGRARETAWWEMGRTAELAKRPGLADSAYLAVDSLGGALADAAALRRFAYALAAGANPEPPRSGDEGHLLWRGLIEWQTGSDTTLAMLTSRPGYTYPRITARETLRVEGTRRSPARAGSSTDHPGLARAAALFHAGFVDEAVVMLDRTIAGAAGSRPGVPGLLAAASLYYGAERWASGIRCTRLALEAAGSDSLRAAIGPWLYPPAHPEWFAGLPVLPDSDHVDRSLVTAVAWQESKFDPRARSRSDALGVLQLKQGTAADMAKLAREKVPSEQDLYVPETSVRLGVRYLRRLIRRFHGSVALALGAYNAGPTGALAWDRGPRAPWGDALTLELVPAGQTHDYAKIILAVRSAYRELAPYVE